MSHQISKPIIILGMHRSGTSCLAGTLQQAGLCLGDVSTSNKFNIKGNREHPDVMKLNNALLHYNNADWNIPPTDFYWDNYHIEASNHLVEKFKQNCISEQWGFKDPRILLTLPFWQKVFPDAIFFGTIRNPIDVAYSLSRRDNGPTLEEGLSLWLSYNKNLLGLLKENPFPLISFDYTSSLYKQKVQELVKEIFPNAPQSSVDFFDNTLRTKPNYSSEIEQNNAKI